MMNSIDGGVEISSEENEMITNGMIVAGVRTEVAASGEASANEQNLIKTSIAIDLLVDLTAIPQHDTEVHRKRKE